MKKTLLNTSIVLLLGAASFASNANGDMYWGANFASSELTSGAHSKDLSLNTVYSRIGKNFNKYFSLEGRIGFGVGDDEFSNQEIKPEENYNYINTTTFNLKLRNTYGLYLRAGLPVNEFFYPYAILGLTQNKIETNKKHRVVHPYNGIDYKFESNSKSITDASYGLGVDLKVHENISINLEYLNYLDKDGMELSGFSIGVISKF